MFIIVKDVNILEESELYASQPARPLDSLNSLGLIATTGAKTVIIISKYS
jgi:hypothetical protein